jgi:hypothetical protein
VAASVRESLRTFCMKFAQKTKDLEIPDNQWTLVTLKHYL